MSRNASIEKKGFFAFPEQSLPYLAGLFHKASFSGGRIIDAVAGEGVALKFLADALNLEPFANELDVNRANIVRQTIPEQNVTQGDYFSLTTSYRGYNIHYLNPPYQYTMDKDSGSNRSETVFLKEGWFWPAKGQYLIFVSYVHHLENRDMVEMMTAMSKSVDVYRVPGKHLNTYMQTICVCTLKDSPNMRKMDMDRANDIVAQASVNYEISLKLRDSGYQPTPEEEAVLFEDITSVTEPRYDLMPLPPGREPFEFHQAEITNAELVRIFGDNQPNMASLLPMLNEQPDSSEFDVIIKPRFLQLVRLVSGGMFNNVLLNTTRGRVILRSYIERVKKEVSRKVEDNGEDGKTTTVKYNIVPTARITLLYEGTGEVENISEYDKLMEFITANRESLMQHIDAHFKPRYKFDFMGGKLRRILNSHTLAKKDKVGTPFRAHLLPPQKHVIAAIVAKLARDKAAILSGKPGTGKTVESASLMAILHAMSGFGPYADELDGVLETPMQAGMFNVVVCPGHLIDKHYREILDVNPDAYVGTIASGDGRKPISDAMDFIRGIQYQPADVLKVLIISRDMGKGGETWKPAYWNRGSVDVPTRTLVHRRSDPFTGEMITAFGKATPIPIGHLERNPLTNRLNSKAHGKAKYAPRRVKKAKFQPQYEALEAAAKKADHEQTKNPHYAAAIRENVLTAIRGKRQEHDQKQEVYTPLWQEARDNSKLKTDPGALLARRLESRFAKRVMPLPDLLNPTLTPGSVDTWTKRQINTAWAARAAEMEYLALPARAPMGGVFRFLAHHYGHLIYLVVADEAHEYCFPANTQVSTDHGNSNIQDIQIGDMVYTRRGDAIVTRKVTNVWVNNRRGKEMVRVTHESGSFIATSNHRVLVNGEYVQAGDLTPGDLLTILLENTDANNNADSNLPNMSEGVFCTPGGAQEILFSEMCGEKAGISGNPHAAFTESQEGTSLKRKFFNPNEDEQSNEQPGNQGENDCDSERNTEPALTQDTARKRLSNGAAETPTRTSGLAYRVSNTDWKPEVEICSPGFSESRTEDCRGGGWPISQLASTEGKGSSKDRNVTQPGMDSASIQQSGSDSTNRVGNRGYTESCVLSVEYIDIPDEIVYDLEVEDTHTYFANGVLVSNSNMSAQGTAMLTLSEKATKLLYMTGTLYGGKASSLYCIEFACNPEVRKRFPMDGGGLWQWVKTMGIIQETVTKSDRSDAGISTRRRKEDKERPNEIPGANPELLLTLIGHMLSVELEDMGRALPDLITVAHDIHMTGEMRDIYDEASEKLTEYLNERLMKDDTSFFGAYFQSLLNWPNFPFKQHDVWHRRQVENAEGRKELLEDWVCTIPAMDPSFITPKEQALLEIVKREISEGRGVAIYVRSSGEDIDGDLQSRLLDLVTRHVPESNPIVLKASVEPARREKWLDNHKNNRVLICNAKLVQTGLDLYQYPTLIFFEIQYSLSVMDQAGKRARRIGQTEECRNIHLYYMSGGVSRNPVSIPPQENTASAVAEEAGWSAGSISETALEALSDILENLEAHGEAPEGEDDGVGRATDTMESRGYRHMRMKQKAASYLYGTEDDDGEESADVGSLSGEILKSLDREIVIDSAMMFSRATAEEAGGDWAAADELEEKPVPELTPEDHRALDLANEQVTITRIEYDPTRRGQNDYWEGWCEDEETTVKVSIWPEDKRLFKKAGYDIKRLFVGRTAKREEWSVPCQIDVILKWEQRNGLRVSEVIPNPKVTQRDLAVRPSPAKDNGHDLLPAWLEAQFPKLYETEGIEADEKIIIAKLFTPDSGFTFLLAEWGAKDRVFFGYTYNASFPAGAEWGYISLDELTSVTGPYGLKVEREIWFQPQTFAQAKATEFPDYDSKPRKMNVFSMQEARMEVDDVSDMLEWTKEDWEIYSQEYGEFIPVFHADENEPPTGYIRMEDLIQIVAEARAKRTLSSGIGTDADRARQWTADLKIGKAYITGNTVTFYIKRTKNRVYWVKNPDGSYTRSEINDGRVVNTMQFAAKQVA